MAGPLMLQCTMIYCAHLVLVDRRRIATEDETRPGLLGRLAEFIDGGSILRGAVFVDGIVIARWDRPQQRFVAVEAADPLGWEGRSLQASSATMRASDQ